MLPLGCLPLWGIEGVTLIIFKIKLPVFSVKKRVTFPYFGL